MAERLHKTNSELFAAQVVSPVCLIFSLPLQTHPLRISANLMRKRSHDLLSYIQDSHDVKSALSEWVATHTSLTPAEAKALQRGDITAVPGITQSTTSTFLGPVAAAAASTPSAQLQGPSVPSPVARETSAAGPSTLVDEKPFEEQRAFTVGSGASLAETAVADRRKDERNLWVLQNLLGHDWSPAYPSETSLGKRRMVVQPVFEAETDDAEVEDIVRSLAGGNAVEASSSFNAVSGASSAVYASPSTRARFAMSRLQQSVFVEEPREGRRQSNGLRQKQRRSRTEATQTNGDASALQQGSPSVAHGDSKAPQRRRGVDCMKRNIKTHGRMHRLKRKFDFLDYCIDNDQPLPSSLLIDSDEEVDDLTSTQRLEEEDVKPHWSSSQYPASLTRRGPSLHVNGMEASSLPNSHPPASGRLDAHPFPHISLPEARSALRDRVSLLCGNAGFASSHSRPLDILSSVLEEFLCSLGRSLRLYLDRYASTTMSAEEILLHTLHTTSSVGPNELEKYLFDDTVRYSNRLEDLKRKMEYSWKERIAIGEEKLVSEEDARFFGAEGSEDLMVGNIPSALDDDFFGFKALGLDQELGMANLTIPARLFRGRGGAAGRRPGEAGGAGKEKEGEKEAFPSPPPFIRISECALPAQIGLLRGFYRDLLHRRGHRGREKRQRQREGTGDADDEADGEEEEDDDEGVLAVSDDEGERAAGSGGGGSGTRGGGGAASSAAGLKIGQAGIMPKRDFWVDPSVLARNSAAGNASVGGAGTQVGSSGTLFAGAGTSTYNGKGGGGGGGGATGKAKGGPGKKGRTKKDG